MLRFGILLLFLYFVTPNNAQGQPCRRLAGCGCPSSTYGQTRQIVGRTGNARTDTCEINYCFGTSNRPYALTDTIIPSLENQNCRAGLLDNQLSTCTSPQYVRFYPCKLCGCSTQYDIQWKEITRYGRTCRAFTCQDVSQFSGRDQFTNIIWSNASCGATAIGEDWRYVPQIPISNSRSFSAFGIIAAPTATGGRIANNGWMSEYSEFDANMKSTWTCPPAVSNMCSNNPDTTLNGTIASSRGIMYQEGALYFSGEGGLNNATRCSVYNCSQGTWGNPVMTFVDNTDISGNAVQLAFVQSQCPVNFGTGTNVRLAPCISGTNGPIYYKFDLLNCGGRNRVNERYQTNTINGRSKSQFCSQFRCGCPASKPNNGDVWFTSRRQMRSRPSGFSTSIQPLWTGYSYYCLTYQCNQDPIARYANYTSFQGNDASSVYGNVAPCDFNLGYQNMVGKYWNGASFQPYSVHTRSSAFANNADAQVTQPKANGSPRQVSNATCRALQSSSSTTMGMATPCYEVKAYTRPTYLLTGTQCSGGNSLTANCAVTPNECQVTFNQRAPVNGYIMQMSSGAFIGYRIQCYNDGENLAQEPYCQMNTQMQNAYETVDKCINNANFQWNVYPKVRGAATCQARHRTYQLQRGVCDHPIFRNYIQHLANCYCAFVRQKNNGPAFVGKEQSILNEFYGAEAALNLMTLGSGDRYSQLITDLRAYGCTYGPIQCSAGGTATVPVDRLSISGTMRVRNACEFANIPSVRRSLETYFTAAGVVTAAGSSLFTNKVLISNVRDVGAGSAAECNMNFKMYVQNRVWANYLVGNLTAMGNGGALWESATASITTETLPVGAASHAQISLSLLLAAMFVGLMW